MNKDLEEFSKIMKLLAYFAGGFAIGFIVVLAFSGCKTTHADTYIYPRAGVVPICNRPNMYLQMNVQWNREDERFLEAASQLCIQQFGQHSCLTKLIKSGQNDFTAVCRNNTIKMVEE